MEKDHMEKLYSSKNPLVGYVHNARLKELVKLVPKKNGIRILDAGCGEGQFLERMSKLFNAEFYGVDISEVSLESAKKRVREAKFSLQNLENLNYKSDFFDVIICSEVIEHIPKYKEVLKELKRVLKKNGLLIVTFPNEPLWTFSRFLLGRRPIKVPDHCNSFSPKEIIKTVNLKIKKKASIPFNLPHFLALTRIIVFIN